MEIEEGRGDMAVVQDQLLKATEAIAKAADALARITGPDAPECARLDRHREELHKLRVKVVGPSRKLILAGAVTCGTLLTSDLIIAFRGELKHLDVAGARSCENYYKNVFDYLRDHGNRLDGASASLLDAAERLREELYDRLNEIAADNADMIFCGLEDEPDCIGFWQIEEEQQA